MKKAEAEKAIRFLSHTWFTGLPADDKKYPSFYTFRSWLREEGHGACLEFKSTMGADYDAEMWFDDALAQNWRN
jgi:hypothetical protein